MEGACILLACVYNGTLKDNVKRYVGLYKKQSINHTYEILLSDSTIIDSRQSSRS